MFITIMAYCYGACFINVSIIDTVLSCLLVLFVLYAAQQSIDTSPVAAAVVPAVPAVPVVVSDALIGIMQARAYPSFDECVDEFFGKQQEQKLRQAAANAEAVANAKVQKVCSYKMNF
jgi:hypothetical protein